MKKSSILFKIMLAMLLVALVFALVACGDNGGTGGGGTGGDDNDDDNQTTASLSEQVTEILKGVNPLLATVNSIKADSTVSVDLGFTIDFEHGVNSEDEQIAGSYTLDVLGNIDSTSPEFSIVYKSDGKEWVNFTFKNNVVYLAQPLTAVNTANDVDKVSANVTALNPAVRDLMSVVMDAIAGVVTVIPSEIPENIMEMNNIGSMIDNMQSALTEMGFEIQALSNGNRIQLNQDIIELVLGMLGNNLPSIVTQLLDVVKEQMGSLPTVTLDIYQSGGVVSGLAIGYSFDETHYGTLNLDISLSTTSKVSVSAPSGYTNQALQAVVEAALPLKDLEATLTASVNPDLSVDGKNLAYASLKINEALLEGYFNGTTAYFDMAAAYEALNATAPTNTVYSAALTNSIVNLLNNGAAKVKENYFANKENTDDSEETGDTVEAAPSKGILGTIYELLGGELALVDKAYVDPTEAQMMAQIRKIAGDYVTFTITDDYFGTVKNILVKFAENDTWLIGWNLVDETKVAAYTSFESLIEDYKAWTNDAPSDANGIYGIFNWDTDAYCGGVILAGEGETKGFLDAVNVFVCHGKDEDGNPIAFTSEYLSGGFANYYIAALGYYLPDGVIFTAEQKAAIDAIDKSFYDDGEITAAEHKTALEAYYTTANANRVITMLIGYAPEGSDNYLKTLIDDGVYLFLGSVKDEGVNGYIGLRQSIDDESQVFVQIGASIGFVSNTVENDAKGVDIDEEAAVELTEVTGTEGEGDEAYDVYGNAQALLDDIYNIILNAFLVF